MVTDLGGKIDPETDRLAIDGKELTHQAPPRVYWLLNKPDEVLTTRASEFNRPTIFGLPSLRKVPFVVFSVGRLDFRTEGLMIITNDGELAHRLTHPRYKIPRHYQVMISGKLSPEEEGQIRQGLVLEDGPTGRVDLQFAGSANLGGSRGSSYFVTVYEGRNRLVRRIFEHFDHRVVRLVRYGFGNLRLPEDLPAGEYRQLTAAEIRELKQATGLA